MAGDIENKLMNGPIVLANRTEDNKNKLDKMVI